VDGDLTADVAKEALDAAVERVYRTFSTRPRAAPQVSPYAGVTDEQIRALAAKPRRDLTKSDLERYARSAMTTWGTPADFKYFMPRILELITRHPGWGDAVMFEALNRAEWRTWPEVEREAVHEYLRALWAWALAAGPDVIHAAMVLCGVGLAVDDLAPWLNEWRTDRGYEATRQIGTLVALEERDVVRGKLASYWHPKDVDAVIAFLREPATHDRLEDAFARTPPGAAARELRIAADTVASLRALGD
jgi:hypothetical protein